MTGFTKALCFPLVPIPLCLAFGWQKKETCFYQQDTLFFPETVHKSGETAIKMGSKELGWVFKTHAGFLAARLPSILTASQNRHTMSNVSSELASIHITTCHHFPIMDTSAFSHSGCVEQTIWLLLVPAKGLNCTSPSPTSLPHAEWYFASLISQLISAKLSLHMSEMSSYITFHGNIMSLERAGFIAPRNEGDSTLLLSKCFVKIVIE